MLCIGESGYFRYNQNLTEENVCNKNEMANIQETNTNSDETRNQQDIQQILDNNIVNLKSKNTINSNDSNENWGKTLLYNFLLSLIHTNNKKKCKYLINFFWLCSVIAHKYILFKTNKVFNI